MQGGSDRTPFGHRPVALLAASPPHLSGKVRERILRWGTTAQQAEAISCGGWKPDRLSECVADAARHGRMIARLGAARSVEPVGVADPCEIEGMPGTRG